MVAFFGFYGVRQPIVTLDHAAFNIVCILRGRAVARAELRLCISIVMLMMVPFDSSRQELSNGCHIVILSNFDLIVEKSGCSL